MTTIARIIRTMQRPQRVARAEYALWIAKREAAHLLVAARRDVRAAERMPDCCEGLAAARYRSARFHIARARDAIRDARADFLRDIAP